ncbi:MAG: MFS transporter [Caldilineaceae bacterium]
MAGCTAGMALGIASGCIASGAIAGPLIGGFLLEALSWRWLFLFNVPIGLFSLLVVWRVVPRLAAGGAVNALTLPAPWPLAARCSASPLP